MWQELKIALQPTMHRRPRGYALLLVLALLSILLILATTLSYTSRLELAATENFARGVQGRFAALSGLPVSAALFAAETDRTHFLQPWAFGGGLAPNDQLNSSLPGAQAQVVLASTLPIGDQSGHLVQAFQGRRSGGNPTIGDGESDRTTRSRGPLSMPSHEINVPGYGMARLRIQDESGKLDINRAGTLSENPERAVADSPALLNLQSFVAAALEEAGLDPNQAPSIARSIVLYRLGPDSEPGEANVDDDDDSVEVGDGDQSFEEPFDPGDWRRQDGSPLTSRGNDEVGAIHPEDDGIDNDADGVIDELREGVDEPDEQVADPRLAPVGDDRVFHRPDDLLRIPIITPSIYGALAPHLTIHSASETRAASRDGVGDSLVDINRADLNTILEQLEIHFPDQPRDLLRQFALNVIDSRDADRVPTEADGGRLLGLERVPLINEVWSDSETATEVGDDGQYVEIINPWNTELDLEGLHLRVAGLWTALGGVLEPGAILIVTDDFDESGDSDPEDEIPQYGSFVEIFNLHPNGTQRRLIVDPLLDLPDTGGEIELIDDDNNVLDRFSWSSTVQTGGLRTSFQRDDPRVRSAERRFCSPWARNTNSEPPAEYFATHGESIPLDRLFATPADLMFVFAGWAEAAEPARRGWRFPEIHSDEYDSLDSSLVDIFSVGPLEPIPAEEPEGDSEVDDANQPLAEEEPEEDGPVIEGREWVIGRININTASRPVLMALPGMTDDLAKGILNWRAQVELMWHSDPSVREAPFTHRGDLLRNDFVWQGVSERDRLLRYRQMVNALTTSSATLRMEAVAATEPGRRTPATAPRTVRAELELRDGAAEVVRLEFWEGL